MQHSAKTLYPNPTGDERVEKSLHYFNYNRRSPEMVNWSASPAGGGRPLQVNRPGLAGLFTRGANWEAVFMSSRPPPPVAFTIGTGRISRTVWFGGTHSWSVLISLKYWSGCSRGTGCFFSLRVFFSGEKKNAFQCYFPLFPTVDSDLFAGKLLPRSRCRLHSTARSLRYIWGTFLCA